MSHARSSTSPTLMRYESLPPWRRVDLWSTVTLLIPSFLGVGSLLYVSSHGGTTDGGVKVWIAVLGTLLTLYCIIASVRLIAKLMHKYTFEILNDSIIFIINRLGQSSFMRMELNEVTFVEYNVARDEPTLVFHTASRVMEVPLWLMTKEPRKVVETLQAKGLRIVRL